MKRYRVEFKAFKTGQWYTKTVIVGDADGVSLFAGNCKNSEKTKVERVPLLRSSSASPFKFLHKSYPEHIFATVAVATRRFVS